MITLKCIIAVALLIILSIILGKFIINRLEKKHFGICLISILVLALVAGFVFLLIIDVYSIKKREALGLWNEAYVVEAKVVSKEASYTKSGNVSNYTVTYNYYVNVKCQTEDGVFSETFDDVDLYEAVKRGDDVEVILSIWYTSSGEVYDYSISMY